MRKEAVAACSNGRYLRTNNVGVLRVPAEVRTERFSEAGRIF